MQSRHWIVIATFLVGLFLGLVSDDVIEPRETRQRAAAKVEDTIGYMAVNCGISGLYVEVGLCLRLYPLGLPSMIGNNKEPFAFYAVKGDYKERYILSKEDFTPDMVTYLESRPAELKQKDFRTNGIIKYRY